MAGSNRDEMPAKLTFVRFESLTSFPLFPGCTCQELARERDLQRRWPGCAIRARVNPDEIGLDTLCAQLTEKVPAPA
jgi:hypothetical protein